MESNLSKKTGVVYMIISFCLAVLALFAFANLNGGSFNLFLHNGLVIGIATLVVCVMLYFLWFSKLKNLKDPVLLIIAGLSCSSLMLCFFDNIEVTQALLVITFVLAVGLFYLAAVSFFKRKLEVIIGLVLVFLLLGFIVV